MQSLTKKIFLLGIFIFVMGVVVACGSDDTTTETNTTEDTIDDGFDMDAVYYSDGYYEVTYKDLYSSIKVNDGIDRLLEIVDRDLLSEYLLEVTQDEIDEKREKLIYNTNDQEEIDDLDEDEVLEKQTAYQNGIYILGYGDDDETYLKLLVARDKYITDLLTNEDFQDKNLFISANSVAEYYELTNQGSVDAIMVRFDSLSEAKAILTENNLVSDHGELRLYTDTETPLEDQPSYNIDETNTRTLTESELLSYFIGFYNEVYSGTKDLLSETATLEDLLDNEDLNYEYSDLEAINSRLGRLLFDGLNAMNEDEAESYYTYSPYEVTVSENDKYYLILNLNKDYQDLSEFDGDEAELISIIGEEKYNELYEEILNRNLSDNSFVAKHLKSFREDNGFEILDYYLNLDYTNIVPEDNEPNNLNRYSDVIAVYNDNEIKVGDLLSYSLELKAPLYIVHAVQLQILKYHHYEDVYCDDTDTCETDYLENDSPAMQAHVSELFELETGFASSMYANYFSFEDYLYLAYGAKTVEDMIQNNYVKKTLEPLFVYDYIQANEADIINEMMALIQPYYDHYFSLDVSHILIFIDENNDGRPDDYDDYYQELDDQMAFDTLVSEFKTDIETYLLENENVLADFVDAYNQAKRDDPTWGEYKRFGLSVLNENLSANKSLNYINSYRNFEEEFVNGLVDIYNDYQDPANIDDEFIYGQDLIQTPYGLHFVKAEKGDKFEMPSAEFTIDPDSTSDYLPGLENTNLEISYSQIQIYMDYRLFEIANSYIDVNFIYEMDQPAIPSRLLETLNFFLAEIYDSQYSVGYLNAAIIGELVSGQLVDQSYEVTTFTKTEIDLFMEELSEIYIYQITSQFEQ